MHEESEIVGLGRGEQPVSEKFHRVPPEWRVRLSTEIGWIPELERQILRLKESGHKQVVGIVYVDRICDEWVMGPRIRARGGPWQILKQIVEAIKGPVLKKDRAEKQYRKKGYKEKWSSFFQPLRKPSFHSLPLVGAARRVPYTLGMTS
jgi:hypothetical protein